MWYGIVGDMGSGKHTVCGMVRWGYGTMVRYRGYILYG